MNDEKLLKIWFCTDIHGSNACFRKFLRLFDIDNEKLPMNKPNVMIIGGDITGNELIPITKREMTGGYRYEYIDRDGNTKHVLPKDIEAESRLLEDGGKYPFICNQRKYELLAYNSKLKDKILDEERKKRVQKWILLVKEKIKKNPDVKVFINCGNDDPLFVDELLGDFQPEGKVIELGGNVKLLSLGYSNLTPWKCPRDVDEQELRDRISNMMNQTYKDDILIFNFHCPPLNTALDEVYEVDLNFQKKNNRIHVGSSSIRYAIENFKPILSLHGHIHEVRYSQTIGETKCVNPGSNYQNGILQGAYFIINDNKIVLEQMVKDLFPEKTGEIPKWFKKIVKILPFIKPTTTF